MHQLTVISYNCESFSKNKEFVRMLLDICDILLLQETLLTDNAIENLGNINSDFDYIATPAVRKNNVFVGKSSGGLAIFYKKSLSRLVKPLLYSERIMGIYVHSRDATYLLLNLYCICDYKDDESMISFRNTMSEISDIYSMNTYDKLILSGDMNSDPSKGRFYDEFTKTVNSLSLRIIDVERLPADSYTYISRNSACSTSWLDHVVSSDNNIIGGINIMYGFSVEDHVPIYFDLLGDFDDHISHVSHSINGKDSFVAWDKVTPFDKYNYEEILMDSIGMYCNDAFSCDDSSCTDPSHLNCLDEAYAFCISSMLRASEILPHYNVSTKNKQVVGWNDHCRDLYGIARDKYFAWNDQKRPRNCGLFYEMKEARRNFRKALDYCKRKEYEIRRTKLLNSFADRKKVEFWKEVKRSGGQTTKSYPSSVDDADGISDIVKVFEMKYKAVFDDELCQFEPEGYGNSIVKLNKRCDMRSCFIFESDIRESMNNLNDAVGWDNIHTNHLKFSGTFFHTFLSRMFSSFMRHSYIPKDMLRGEFRPILKNAKGSRNESSNYRPIMISSCILKLFEYCLLPIFKRYIKPNKWQFGYVPNASCASAGLILKETVLNYTRSGSKVHCAMLDFSKAFDRINVKVLIQKLISSNLPVLIIRVLKYMFENVYVHVSFAQMCGSVWKMGNGTRQGGILSPYLFNFYMHDVISYIASLDVGCSIDYESVNILAYADDITLLAPSQEGLQILIDVFCNFIRNMSLHFNDKSTYIVFSGNRSTASYSVLLNGDILQNESQCKYLGYILSSDSKIDLDVDRCYTSFLRQFNSMFRKFNFLNRNILSFLFRSFCSSFYGSELWFDQIIVHSKTNKLTVSYHRALKRIAGLSPWDSNHHASDLTGIPILRHFLALKIINFLFSIVIRPTDCILGSLKLYFKHSSNICKGVSDMFLKWYSVKNIFRNDISALRSRIFFVQQNEPRSFYNIPS